MRTQRRRIMDSIQSTQPTEPLPRTYQHTVRSTKVINLNNLDRVREETVYTYTVYDQAGRLHTTVNNHTRTYSV